MITKTRFCKHSGLVNGGSAAIKVVFKLFDEPHTCRFRKPDLRGKTDHRGNINRRVLINVWNHKFVRNNASGKSADADRPTERLIGRRMMDELAARTHLTLHSTFKKGSVFAKRTLHEPSPFQGNRIRSMSMGS